MTLKFWKADRLWEIDFIASRSTVSSKQKSDPSESKIAIKQETVEAFQEDSPPPLQSTLNIYDPWNDYIYTQIFRFNKSPFRREIWFHNLSVQNEVRLQHLAHVYGFEYEYSVPTRSARVSRLTTPKEFGPSMSGDDVRDEVEGGNAGRVFRSGNSCWTCELSKKHCDRLIPICSSCSMDNKDCVGYHVTTQTQYGRG